MPIRSCCSVWPRSSPGSITTCPPSQRASQEQSHLCRLSYSLKNSEGQHVARIPLGQLQKGLDARRRTLRRLLHRAGIRWTSSPNTRHEAQQITQAIKRQPYEIGALAWGISTGQPYPRGPGFARQLLIALLLLFCGVIPGLIFLYLLFRRWNRYRNDLEQLVKRWRVAGLPDPDPAFLLSVISRPALSAHP